MCTNSNVIKTNKFLENSFYIKNCKNYYVNNGVV